MRGERHTVVKEDAQTVPDRQDRTREDRRSGPREFDIKNLIVIGDSARASDWRARGGVLGGLGLASTRGAGGVAVSADKQWAVGAK